MLRVIAIVSLALAAAHAEAGAGYTLDGAVRKALADNPDARIAASRITAAQAALMQASAAFQPQVRIESSYVRTDHPVSVFGFALNQESFSPALNFNNVPAADNWNARGLLTVPLYAGGRNVAGREAARAGLAAAGHDADAVRRLLAFEVARTFHLVGKTRSLIEAAESAVRSFETNTALAEKRFAAGTALKVDLLDMEVRLAQAREDLVRTRNANAFARRALGNLLGLGNDAPVDIAKTSADAGTPSLDDKQERPEIRAAVEQARAATAEIRRARSGWAPSVNAFASVDHDQGTEFDGAGSSYTVGVMFQWNLWDGNLTRGKLREAEARRAMADEQTRKLKLAIELEIEQGRLAVKDADERLNVTVKTIAAAAESAQITRDRFEKGLALTSQIIDAETALTAARVRRAEAEADRRIAVAALRHALGLAQVPNQNPF